MARANDGTFYVGDEYGPAILHFDANGALLGRLTVPEAFVPKRGNYPGANVFGTNAIVSGRIRNRGFEGLSITPDGRRLVAALQSPLQQDCSASVLGRNTRLLQRTLQSRDQAPSVRRDAQPFKPAVANTAGDNRVGAEDIRAGIITALGHEGLGHGDSSEQRAVRVEVQDGRAVFVADVERAVIRARQSFRVQAAMTLAETGRRRLRPERRVCVVGLEAGDVRAVVGEHRRRRVAQHDLRLVRGRAAVVGRDGEAEGVQARMVIRVAPLNPRSGTP